LFAICEFLLDQWAKVDQAIGTTRHRAGCLKNPIWRAHGARFLTEEISEIVCDDPGQWIE